MSSWVWWMILGILIGWVIEWIIDWIYWRPRITDAAETGRADSIRYQEELKALKVASQKDKANYDALNKSVVDLRDENTRLSAELSGLVNLRAENARLNADFGSLKTNFDAQQADLSALASLRAENDRLNADFGSLKANFDAQQADVSALANLRAENDRLNAEFGSLRANFDTQQADVSALASLRAENDRLNAEFGSLKANFDAQQTDLSALASLRAENARLIAELEAYKSSASSGLSQPLLGEVSTQEVETISIPTPLVTAPVSEARKRDPLIDIYGIGEAFEKRLFNAGIYTFEELANTSPQRLREIINPESWQKIEPESWIAEARLFAEKQRGAKS